MDVLELIEQAIASPWLYLIVATAVAVDAFLPIVPGEAVVITGGVFAASGELPLAALVAVAAVGALVGDHIAYTVGRGVRSVGDRIRRHPRAGARLDWAEDVLARHGGWLLITARFVPAGRTVTTMAAGVVGYPRRRFLLFAGIAGLAWAIYTALLGYWGGAVFAGEPGWAMIFGIGLGLVLGVIGEAVRRVLAQRVSRRARLREGYDAPSARTRAGTRDDVAEEPFLR